MTQITITQTSRHTTEKCLMNVSADGVQVSWATIAVREVLWEEMEDPEKLCEIFGDMRVQYFVELAKWLADAYAKRSAFQEVQW